MKLNRRDMLTLAGVAVSGAALGRLEAAEPRPSDTKPGLRAKPQRAGVAAVCLADFEPLAKERFSHFAYEYISSGAADELTIRWNREAFDQIRLRPKVLVDVERIDTRVTLFGQELPHPILLAPTARQRLSPPEGEVATARGAGLAGAIFVAGTLSTRRLQDIMPVAKAP